MHPAKPRASARGFFSPPFHAPAPLGLHRCLGADGAGPRERRAVHRRGGGCRPFLPARQRHGGQALDRGNRRPRRGGVRLRRRWALGRLAGAGRAVGGARRCRACDIRWPLLSRRPWERGRLARTGERREPECGRDARAPSGCGSGCHRMSHTRPCVARRCAVPQCEHGRRLALRGHHRSIGRSRQRIRHGDRHRRHRQRRRFGRLPGQLRPEPALREHRRRALPRDKRVGRLRRVPRMVGNGQLRRLRRRRPAGPLRRQLPSIRPRQQQDLPRHGLAARLLRTVRLRAGRRPPVPQSRQSPLRRGHRHRRLRPRRVRRRARRRGRGLRRRRRHGFLRRQRWRGQPPVAEPRPPKRSRASPKTRCSPASP